MSVFRNICLNIKFCSITSHLEHPSCVPNMCSSNVLVIFGHVITNPYRSCATTHSSRVYGIYRSHPPLAKLGREIQCSGALRSAFGLNPTTVVFLLLE